MILDHESDGDPVCGSVRAPADLLAKNDRFEQATAQALECVELVRGRSSERIISGGAIPPRPKKRPAPILPGGPPARLEPLEPRHLTDLVAAGDEDPDVFRFVTVSPYVVGWQGWLPPGVGRPRAG